MTSEEYGQLIDDFELDKKIGLIPEDLDLTSYIEQRRREFDSKADGGVIGIEVKIADEMAKGGRVGLFSGGALKGLASLFKGGKDKIDDIIETKAMEKIGFRSRDDIPLSTYSEMKGPIKLSDMENIPEDQLKKILRTQELGLYEETPELLKAANLLERFTKKVKGKRVIDYDRAEAILNVKLKGNETLDDLFRIEFETRPENRLADGGRVGLFMGGPALEGQALDIYNSMSAYGFSDQQIADALSARGLYTAAGSGTTTQPEQVTGIINQQLQTGGGDGPQGDFGIFGNLDKSTAKDFNVEVYDEEVGDFVPTTITGYKNVNSGLYQDKFGKNLQPMFSNTGFTPGFLGTALSLTGMKPQTVGGFVPGSIRGKYDGIRDIFNKQKKQQEDIVRQQQEEKARQERLKRELEALAAQGRDYGSGGGRDESLNLGPGGSYTGKGDTGTPGLDSIDYDLKDGGPVGVATMFTRRR